MSALQDRRTFFRSVGRGAALGTLGLFGLLLYGRRRNPEVCINRSVCGTCRAFGECELPAARSAKRARHVAQASSPWPHTHEQATIDGTGAVRAPLRHRQEPSPHKRYAVTRACATPQRTEHV